MTYQTALVTGASRGIGRAIAIKLSREGMNVIVNYFSSEEEAKKTLQEIEKEGGRGILAKADVADEKQVYQMFETAKEAFGDVDVLISNAGSNKRFPVTEMSIEDWDFVQNTNLKGTFLCCKYAAIGMKENRNGRIVCISSVLGQAALPNRSCYCSTKSAIIGFANSLSLELAPYCINVNSVCPGWIESDMTSYLKPEIREEMERQIPLGRFGRAEEVANVVAFLLTEAGDYITGSQINIDGGRRDFVWQFE